LVADVAEGENGLASGNQGRAEIEDSRFEDSRGEQTKIEDSRLKIADWEDRDRSCYAGVKSGILVSRIGVPRQLGLRFYGFLVWE